MRCRACACGAAAACGEGRPHLDVAPFALHRDRARQQVHVGAELLDRVDLEEEERLDPVDVRLEHLERRRVHLALVGVVARRSRQRLGDGAVRVHDGRELLAALGQRLQLDQALRLARKLQRVALEAVAVGVTDCVVLGRGVVVDPRVGALQRGLRAVERDWQRPQLVRERRECQALLHGGFGSGTRRLGTGPVKACRSRGTQGCVQRLVCTAKA
eukprot:4921568-Prymnesium_polylepis.1